VDPVSWTLDAPIDATVRYRRQFRHIVVLEGTDGAHVVTVTFTLDGQSGTRDVFGTWANWSDAATALSVSAETSGVSVRTTEDPTSWTATAPLDVLVRYREATSQPPATEANWKPAIALVFSLTILAAALVRRRRGADRRTTLLHVPFVAIEASIGAASWALGILSVPPWIGAGTIVNGAILAAGLLVPGWRYFRR
jgi:hypothetical protein